MITKEKLKELRRRILHHEVKSDVAVVKLTAKELYGLLDTIEGLQKLLEIVNGSHFQNR
jgi:hypothetical protein